ncbi:MAG: hypothetical protein K2K60_02925 [Clostridia bacterium]|nr:hypothetical protein [Clostridia bacterium]
MKELTEVEIQNIKKDLTSSKSAKRRSAAKKIGKFKIYKLEQELLAAYLKERKDTRTWETQTEMIKACGKIGCKASIPYLKEIIDINKDEDTITIFATVSYIRLTRKCVNDMSVTLEFMKSGNASVFCGCITAIAYDDVVPTNSEITEIMKLLNEKTSLYDRLYSCHVQYILSAMHLWPQELTKPFLDRYKNTRYANFVENTLKGKKSIVVY